MWTPLLDRIWKLVESRGGWVIGVIVALTILMGAAIPGLKISSSYRDLMPAEHPDLQAYDAFLDAFGAANDLIVVLEGEPKVIRSASNELAARLSSKGEPISDVFHRIDVEELAKRAPLFLDTEMLDSLLREAESKAGVMSSFAGASSLPETLNRLSALVSGEAEDSGWDAASAPQAIEFLTWFFGEWEARLTDAERQGLSMPTLPGSDSEAIDEAMEYLKSEGFLGSRDFEMVFLFVRPDQTNDDPDYLGTVEKVVREEWKAVLETNAADYGSVTMGLTGLPAHLLTDVRSLRTDILRAGIPSALMVFIILWVGLRSVRRAMIALLPLGCGLVISLGSIRFIFEELNRMSVSFLAIMFGIGIDFAIYLIRRTDEEIAGGLTKPEAVRKALGKSGQGIISGGLVTALAFSVTAVSEFRGTSQLGLTTAISVVVVLAVTLLFLPPIVLRTQAVDGVGKSRLGFSWFPKTAMSRPIVGGLFFAFIGIAVVGGFVASRVPIDFSGLSVMPRGAESTEYQIKMQENSDFQMTSAVLQADSREALDKIVEQVKLLPTVAQVVSLSDLIPERQPEKIAVMRDHAGVLEVNWPQLTPANSHASLDSHLNALANFEEALFEAQDLAFSAGQKDLTEGLQSAIDAVEALQAQIERNPETSLAKTQSFENELQAGIDRLRGYLAAWRNLEPMDESALPDGFVRRFRSESGRYAAFVYPSGSVWDVEFLDKFLEELRGVSPEVTGFPVISQSTITLLVNGIFLSLVLTLGVVVVLLAFDLRSLKKVVFALFPLLVGMALLQAWLFLSGQEYNLASINGLPLLLGLGVVYGVHLVHRWSENPDAGAFHAVRTSGRAIALAGITTMAGLASLTFCLHRGMATFGGLLLQGIVCMLIAALVALPLAIDWFSGQSGANEKAGDQD